MNLNTHNTHIKYVKKHSLLYYFSWLFILVHRTPNNNKHHLITNCHPNIHPPPLPHTHTTTTNKTIATNKNWNTFLYLNAKSPRDQFCWPSNFAQLNKIASNLRDDILGQWSLSQTKWHARLFWWSKPFFVMFMLMNEYKRIKMTIRVSISAAGWPSIIQ